MDEAIANHHGQWIVRGTPAHRAHLEQYTGPLPDDDERISGVYGPPDPGTSQCSYCGSITPEEFVRGCEAGYRMEVADWKYGWPHKVYVDFPNPKPEERRIVGRTTQGGKVLKEDWGTYPTLHLKFYTEHLRDWPGLEQHAELIERSTGVGFRMAEGKLQWSAIPLRYGR